MAELMKIVGLKRSYDQNSGITDIDMHISRETLHGFLGLNGSGKTTTMKIIMGLLKRDDGKIEYEGREYDPSNVNDIGIIHRRCSWLPSIILEKMTERRTNRMDNVHITSNFSVIFPK